VEKPVEYEASVVVGEKSLFVVYQNNFTADVPALHPFMNLYI
jgi:hypothetical protein